MAIFKDLENKIESLETPWNEKTGQLVEDLISRHLVNSMDFADSTLTLRDYNGDAIASTRVTVETPSYDLDVLLVAVRINGTIYKTGEVVMLCNSKSKVELAVATSHTSTTLSFGVQDAAGAVKVKIQYGVNSMETTVAPYSLNDFTLDSSGTKIEHLNKADSELKWVNITELFTDSLESTITATLVDYPQKSSILNVTIKSQKISLYYTGNVISNNAEFTLKGGAPIDYHLEGYLNARPINTTDGNLTYSDLQSGLNTLTIRAVHKSLNIATDYVNACVIKPEGFTGVAVAVNGITGSINNHDTVKLYTITVYSPTKDSVTINTYLNSDSADDRLNLLDTVVVNALNYDSDKKYETTYKKYIEVNSDNAKLYLQVEVNGLLYLFLSASSDKAFMSTNLTISISKANINYLYTSSPRPTINFDLISGRTTTLFNDSPDYWKASDGKIIYRIEANANKVFETPVNLQLSNNFTLEFGFKSYNVSNEESPVITFGQMLIKPTVVCWNTSAELLYNARFAQFKEDADTHITITVQKGFTLNLNDPYYPNYFLSLNSYNTLKANLESAKFNLVRIYVNGVINREISIDDATLLALLREALLQINPKGSDLDLYLLRVYNSTALTFDLILHNYISFLATRELKDKFYDRNNILGTDGTISFVKSFGKYNTLVYVFPKGGKLPNRTWQSENNKPGDQDKAAKKIRCTLFINYADLKINKIYGGRINNGLVKGLGSSAMRYLIWNTAFLLNKFKDGKTKVKSIFTPYEDLDTTTNRFIAKPAHEKKGYYNMPPYDGLTDSTEKDLKVTKLVGKVNFASSMQSHKEGACKLYNDAYKADTDLKGLLFTGGRKAVHEEAFLYFYLITDLESVANYELADLLKNPNVLFMGFQTFGSAKGDKATFGYDDDKTKEYILIEGGENSDPHVNFRRPWAALQRAGLNSAGSRTLTNFPTVTVEELQSPNRDYSKNLWISDESIVYLNRGSWDVDFGLNDEATDFTEPARKSLNKFGEFVDFVYKYNFNLVKTGETDITKWNTLNRYIATKPIPAFTGSREGDIYRYDEFAGSTSATGEAVGGWVRGGTIYDPSTGWSRLNIYEDFEIDSSINLLDIAIDELKSLFKKGITKYIDVNDVAMHQAVIRFLSGTDNRAKNTYFLIFGKIYENIALTDEVANWQPSDKGDYLIRLYGDDLDTIIATDNNGLLSKPYNLLEPSYVPETASQWGDSGLNAFFYMFDLLFEDIIKNKLYKVINQAFGTASGENTNFYKYFYSILTDKYPAIAYNHTAQIYYENAQIIKNAGAIEYYDNNQIEPIELSHGSCLEGEQLFMEKRRNFLASYTKLSETPDYKTGSSAGGNDKRPLLLRLEFTPFLDFYPTYFYDGTKYLMPNSSTDYRPDIIKYLAKADLDYVVNLKETGTAINEGLISTVLYKKLNITGLVNYSIAPEKEYTRLTNFTIDNNNLKTYKDFFGTDYPLYRLDVFSMKGPVLESLTLNNMTTLETLNLTDFNKLKEINLSGTTFKRVILPSKAETVILPETIETLELYNPVKELRLEGISNLKTVDLSNVGQFDVDSFLELLVDCNSLESVSLRNLTINVTEQTLSKLLSVKNNITGTINIVDSTGDLVEISYDTKKSLVELFGDIDSEANNPKVNYKASSSAFSATCDSEITIFGLGDKGTGKFNLLINSNLVEIVNDPTPRLHIDYLLASSTYDLYLRVDSKTGNITLIKESTTVLPVINILVYRIGSSTPTRLTCKVKILWTAPKIGDFVYYDGSYSNNYNTNKTCIGMVYAVENTNDTSGTAYVIGKENMTENTSFYLGFSPEGVNGGDNVTLRELYYIGDWLKNLRLITSANSSDSNDYIAMSGVSTDKPVDEITYASYTDFTTNGFTGKEDTAIYVNTVNTSVLSKLYSSFLNLVKSYITYDSTTLTYSIKSMDKLVALCKGLKITNVTSDELSSCIIYPYYYAATLYQPTLKSTESAIYNLFALGNWYIPSAKLLARIMYYRGYSSKGTNFIDSTSVSETIAKISSGSEAKNKAIFSNAKLVMGTNFPSVWANIANNLNTTTTINTSSNYNSYSYLSMCTDYSCTAHRYEWIPGRTFSNNSYDVNMSLYEAAWRVTKHLGVPFTQFTYNKDTLND